MNLAQRWLAQPYLDPFRPLPISRGWAAFTANVVASRKTGVMIAPPGSGKTITLAQIAYKEGPLVCSIKATRTSGRARTILARIAHELEIYVGAGNGYDIESALWRDLPHIAEQGCWLIIDEAQNLEADALRAVLDLNDEAGLPILFAGNGDLLKRTRSTGAAFDQIKSRVREMAIPDGATRLDVDALAIDRNVDGRDAYRFLYHFGKGARKGCDLRRTADLLNEGRAVAGPAGPIRLKHLEKAVQRLYGDYALARFIKSDNQEENAA